MQDDEAFAVGRFFSGDGVCESEFGETFDSSPNDCPQPVSAPPPEEDDDGGGGGGGGTGTGGTGGAGGAGGVGDFELPAQ